MHFSLTQFQQLVNQAYEQAASQTPEHLENAVGAIVQNPMTMEKSVISIIANPSSIMPLDPFCQTISQLFVQELGCHTCMTRLSKRSVQSLSPKDKTCLLIDPFDDSGVINSESPWVSLVLTKKLLEQELETQETALAVTQQMQMQLQPQLSPVVTKPAIMLSLKRPPTEELLAEAPAAKRMPPETTTDSAAVSASEQRFEAQQKQEKETLLLPLPPFDPSIFRPPVIVGDDELAVTEYPLNIDVSTMAESQVQNVEDTSVVASAETLTIQSLLDQIKLLINSHGESAYGYYDENNKRYDAEQLTQRELNNYQRITSPSRSSLRSFAEQVLKLVKGIQLRCIDIIHHGPICEENLVIQGLTAEKKLICSLADNCKLDKLTLKQAHWLLTAFIEKQHVDIPITFPPNHFQQLVPRRNPGGVLTPDEQVMILQVANLNSLGETGKAQLLKVTYDKLQRLKTHANKPQASELQASKPQASEPQ